LDHAVLAVHPWVGVYSVDGSIASWTAQGNTMYTKKEPRILLPSGEHVLAVRFFRQTSTGGQGNYGFATTESKYVNITQKFEAGRYYYLYPIVRNRVGEWGVVDVTFQLIDETNSTDKNAIKRIAASNKVMKKAKYPSKETNAMGVQRAVDDAPTVLEGTWVLSDNPQFIYTFEGSMVQIAAQGQYPSYRGILELTDKTITINYTQHNGTGSWSDILLIKQSTVYEYSINAEGRLLLTRTGGRNDTGKNDSGISVGRGEFIKK